MTDHGSRTIFTGASPRHAPLSASPLRLTEASAWAFPVCATRGAAKGLAGRPRHSNCVVSRVPYNRRVRVRILEFRYGVLSAAAVGPIDHDVVRLERISEASISGSQVRLQKDRVHDPQGREAAQGAADARGSQGRRDELKAETEASDRTTVDMMSSLSTDIVLASKTCVGSAGHCLSDELRVWL
jgi:hypothetical protein